MSMVRLTGSSDRAVSRQIEEEVSANLVLVKFRLIVFRPFKGEIILGKITSSSENGIKSTSLRQEESP